MDQVAGASIAFVGTSLTALGFVLQKKSHVVAGTSLPDAEESAAWPHTAGLSTLPRTAIDLTQTPRPFWRNRYFALGLLCQVIGLASAILVLAFLPQSEAYAFGALTLLWIVVWSRVLLHERAGWKTGVGLAVVTLGVVCIAVANATSKRTDGDDDSDRPERDYAWLHEKLTRPTARVGFAVVALLIAGLVYTTYARTRARTRRQSSEWWQLQLADAQPNNTDLLLRAVLAGLLGGVTAVALSAVVGMGKAGWVNKRPHQVNTVFFGGALVTLVLSVSFQVHFVNLAMRDFPATKTVPVYQTVLMFAGVGFGWLFYNEIAGRSGRNIVLAVAGLLFALAGMVTVARSRLQASRCPRRVGEIQ